MRWKPTEFQQNPQPCVAQHLANAESCPQGHTLQIYSTKNRETIKRSSWLTNFTRRKLDLQVKVEWKPCNEIRNKWRCLTLTWKGLNQTQHHSEDSSTCHLPTQDNNEVHHIPAVPQVRALVECKSQSNDFYSSFKAKHSYEVGLCFFLRKEYRLDVRQQKLP